MQKIGVATLGASLPLTSTVEANAYAAKHVNVALIGVRGMGWADLTSFLKNPDTICVGLCDVDAELLGRRAADIEKRYGNKPQTFGDHRELLRMKDLDAVIIGTPDHWHCLILCDACAAGKDVYVEKPIANSIEEADLMVKATRKHERIVQVGQWQRSDWHWQDALKELHSGSIGKIRQVKAWADVNYGRNFDVVPDSTPPQGVDYDRWLGPAPKRPFNKNRFHGTFRYFWDYAGGLMTDWGVHMLDMVLAGTQAQSPKSVMAIGGKLAFPNDAAETPDTLTTVYDFGDFSLVWEQFMAMGTSPYLDDSSEPGVAFIGEKGILAVNRVHWKLMPLQDNGKYLMEALPTRRSYDSGLDAHTRNWLECIRERKDPNCTIEMGRDAAVVAHLGNIAYRTGRKLEWDAAKRTFKNDLESNKFLKPTYRSPWELPKV
ncbi:MAG: Gfo/Idh/MocA family oxidoreductase [Spirosomataceae bacterium]